MSEILSLDRGKLNGEWSHVKENNEAREGELDCENFNWIVFFLNSGNSIKMFRECIRNDPLIREKVHELKKDVQDFLRPFPCPGFGDIWKECIGLKLGGLTGLMYRSTNTRVLRIVFSRDRNDQCTKIVHTISVTFSVKCRGLLVNKKITQCNSTVLNPKVDYLVNLLSRLPCSQHVRKIIFNA